jgi:hypothetical protein
MIGRLAVACLLLAAPAAAQTRAYTNADLGKPLTWSRTPTPEEMASLIANQFVPMPHIPDAPVVRTINGDPSHGPFGPFELSAYTQPLDPNWYGDGFGYWPGYIGSFAVGKRGVGFGDGFRDRGRFSRNNGHPRGETRGPGRSVTPPPAPAPAPAPGGSTRLAGSAAAVKRPARR